MSVMSWSKGKARAAGNSLLDKAKQRLKSKLASLTVTVSAAQANGDSEDFTKVIRTRLEDGKCPIQISENRWCAKKLARISRRAGTGWSCGSYEHALAMSELIEAGVFDADQ
jgi:hypothetical protein